MSELDEQIASADGKVAQLVSEVPGAKENLLDAAVQFCAEWIDHMAKQTVASQPQQTKALGHEALSQLKAEINALKEALPAKVRVAFDESKTLPSLDDIQSADNPASLGWRIMATSAYGNRKLPGGVDAAVRLVIGELGPLLMARGFDQGSDRWGSGTPRWRYNLDASDGLCAACNQFTEVWIALGQASKSARHIRERRESDEAIDIWDEAW